MTHVLIIYPNIKDCSEWLRGKIKLYKTTDNNFDCSLFYALGVRN